TVSPDRPLPPEARSATDARLEGLIRDHGLVVRQVARATPGYPAGGFVPARELLPELLASRRGMLVSGVTAARLRTDANGRVIGALCRTQDGASKTARARTYVIA